MSDPSDTATPRLAVTTFSFRKSDASPEEITGWIASAGVAEVEWFGPQVEDAGRLRRASVDLGVAPVCYSFTLPELIAGEKCCVDRGRVASELGKAVALGVPRVMVFTPNDCSDRERSRGVWIEGLAVVAALAESHGLELCIENFPGKFSPFVTSADFLAARSAVPSLKLALDSGNCLPGEDPRDCYRQAREAVVQIHCKDVAAVPAGAPEAGEMLDGRWYRTVPCGEGAVPFDGLLAMAAADAFPGPLVLEYGNLPAGRETAVDWMARGAERLRAFHGGAAQPGGAS